MASIWECDVREPMTPGAAFALAFKLNNDGPLPFDRETRDANIRQLSKFKLDNGKPEFTMEQIGSQTGISKFQVSRILKGQSSLPKMELSKKRRAGARKGHAKRQARLSGGYDSATFFRTLYDIAKTAKSHMKVLAENLAAHDKQAGGAIGDLILQLTEMRDAAKKAVKNGVAK